MELPRVEGKRGGRTAVLVGTGLGSRWHPAGGGRGAAQHPPLGVVRPQMVVVPGLGARLW